MFNVRNLRSAAVLLLASAAFFGVAPSCSTANYEPKTAEEAVYLQQAALAEAKAWTELATTVAWTFHDLSNSGRASRSSASTANPDAPPPAPGAVVVATARILRADVKVFAKDGGYVASAESGSASAQGSVKPDLQSAKVEAAVLADGVTKAAAAGAKSP